MDSYNRQQDVMKMHFKKTSDLPPQKKKKHQTLVWKWALMWKNEPYMQTRQQQGNAEGYILNLTISKQT